ncbi:MAG: tetratricopeptide repeat protein [Candidatus Nitronauta litoralis]|uniref:Tetratricopeptide repeat protein n=1 Tax=Candidatus Nitronauta litoralis TaxID=2705533 RepID=A0A7T0BTC8_9BACT|nr:MAG: tetratricopeptide repeat protein [Candidatus Nitronauta litoralis]
MPFSKIKEEVSQFYSKATKTGEIPGREYHAIIMMREIQPYVSDIDGYWFNYGFYLNNVGLVQEAINAFIKSLEFNFAGIHWPAYAILGKLYSETNQRLEADHWYDLTIKENSPVAGTCWILKGSNLSMLGDFERAKECYENSLKDISGECDKDEALFNLANICCIKGDYERGLEFIKRSYSIDPEVKRTNRLLNDVESLINFELKNQKFKTKDAVKSKFDLADEYIKKEWYFCALETLREYQKQIPKNPKIWERMGVCMINVGMGREGRKALNMALEYSDGAEQKTIYSTMAELCMDFGSLSEADKWFEKTILCQGFVEDWVFFRRGECLAKMGKYIKARECFEQSIDCEGSWVNPDMKYLSVGLMFRNEERFEDAVSALREALRLNPKNEKAKEALDGLSGIDKTIEYAKQECERIKSL